MQEDRTVYHEGINPDRSKRGNGMVRLEEGKYIIGFDDGYQLGKTANFVFNNGIHRLGATETTLKEHSLFYDGEYFKVGEGRAAITEDKVSDDDARLRTMAAAAMELGGAGIHKAEVVLAVGLPFSNYGRDKPKLIDYYKQQNRLGFSYEGEDYFLEIGKVIVCPPVLFSHRHKAGEYEGRLPGGGYRQQDHRCGVCAGWPAHREQVDYHRKGRGEMDQGNPA